MIYDRFFSIFTINIFFVLTIKSLASGLSILNFFTTEQIQYFFQVSSLAQLFFFTISLGHTSDKDFSFFNPKQLMFVAVRLIILLLFLMVFDTSSIDYLLPAVIFSLLMVFNAFVDFRVKYYRLYIHSLQCFILVGCLSIIVTLASMNFESGRIFIQVIPFSIYAALIFFLNVKKRDIWFCSNSSYNKLNKLLFVYASLTSLYTFLDRRFVANFGHEHFHTIFFIINFLSLAIFFLDYVFKRKNQSDVNFIIGVVFYNIIALVLILFLSEYRVEVFYTCVLLFQFFFFSFYVVNKKKSVIISLSIFFFAVCVILLCGNYDIISFFNVYFSLYLLQLIFSFYFFMTILEVRKRVSNLYRSGAVDSEPNFE